VDRAINNFFVNKPGTIKYIGTSVQTTFKSNFDINLTAIGTWYVVFPIDTSAPPTNISAIITTSDKSPCEYNFTSKHMTMEALLDLI
jgi:hypothetical protein